VLSIDRQKNPQRSNEVGAFSHKAIAFAQRLSYESDFGILQIAQATVNDSSRAAGSAGSEIILFKQKYAVSSASTFTRNGDAIDATADHDDLEALTFQRRPRDRA